MLTALELAGFKSFAEKTRFDFPDGITVVVGPNGSGKSNVVDAIKWVLGAQSAKALRGKEMSDVIFKGSTSAGRKPANSAEATLIFDNSEKKLPVDAEEVAVTRRVYRSGEGEYLINGQACRLKDIRNLFRGTGVGVDAYSLIEQGKVDRMLQASPRDRRIIFEEAAGISRFNAKKAEANRRLERVEQNLVRLKDIVDEVHTRLSRLKSQASKAQRYREMTNRLRELRVSLGASELTQLEQKIQSLEARLKTLGEEHTSKEAEADSARQAAQEAELQLHEVARQCQQVESGLQDALQEIAVGQNRQQALWERIRESEDEGRRQIARLAVLRQKSSVVQQEVSDVAQQVAVCQQEHQQAAARVDQSSSQTNQLRERLMQLRTQREDKQRALADIQEELAKILAEVSKREKSTSSLEAEITETEGVLATNEKSLASARAVTSEAEQKLAESKTAETVALDALSQHRKLVSSRKAEIAKLQEQNALIRGRLSGAEERLEILEQLQQHLDGVDAGARFLIDLANQSAEPAFATIHGLVADLITVDVKMAEIIDTALGASAGILVLKDGQLIQRLRDGRLEIPGRLSLIRLDSIPARRLGEKVQLEGIHGVVGRADCLVECQEEFLPLVRHLLGTTWVVENLEVALELGHFRGAGLRFITRNGELIESDGRLTLGAVQSASGLVSRKSEIEDGRAEIEVLRAQLSQGQRQLTTSERELQADLEPQLEELESTAQAATRDLARHKALSESAQQTLASIVSERQRLQQALETKSAECQQLKPLLEKLGADAEQLREQDGQLKQQLAELEGQIRQANAAFEEGTAESTAAKVELARVEQKLEAITAAHEQSLRGQNERSQALRDAESEMERIRTKIQTSELEVLQLTETLAGAFLRRESTESELDLLAVEADQWRRRRQETASALESASRALDKLVQRRETSQLEVDRFAESRNVLLKRYVEDYQIERNELVEGEATQDSSEIEAMESEAATLRNDIASVGEINMAALAELDELQGRYDSLNGQYEDLQAAKESLQRIIQKINQDSRRLFTETLEVIRQNFQQLYRKCFGGGSADIVLEEGDDVLECGIEIIATPPGKTALSNSLLSGGEKALTAVALLLAIFQHRPSPFCVLDEVDAPFDEANIGRFVNVLHEFLDWTKFIVVTHSKKTMTAATTLYGVTMQESGVSKQVAVRFEDVNEKGEIIAPDKSGPQKRAA